jgi:hypothetical protein
MADAPKDEADRELTFAQLIKLADPGEQAQPTESIGDLDPGATEATVPAQVARPRARDDELLTELPPHDYHLGRFAGWRATRKLRWFVGGTLGATVLVGIVLLIAHRRQLLYEERHPLPEVEATITPGTPREMSLSDGRMRVGLGREPPAVNILHLPDRDITLARGSDKAQFKVEVRDGKTVRLQVLTGEIVETLTDETATPLLE